MVAVDIPRKRIFIRGDLFRGYYWLMRYFLPQYVTMFMPRPFWMPEPGVLQGINGWTIEHEPNSHDLQQIILDRRYGL